MSELEDANNPDAEETMRQRYTQAKSRLEAELRDHVTTKMENLDEDHSALEYVFLVYSFLFICFLQTLFLMNL